MPGLVDGLEQEVLRELQKAASTSDLVERARSQADALEKIAKLGDDLMDESLLEVFREGSSDPDRTMQTERIRSLLSRAGVMGGS
jgi:hypothetical protein